MQFKSGIEVKRLANNVEQRKDKLSQKYAHLPIQFNLNMQDQLTQQDQLIDECLQVFENYAPAAPIQQDKEERKMEEKVEVKQEKEVKKEEAVNPPKAQEKELDELEDFLDDLL